jgi:glucose/arabinose dehydrogenase
MSLCARAGIVLLAACGHHDVPGEAAVPASCGPGSTVTVRRVASGCGQSDSPAPPNCMLGGLTLVTSPPSDPRLFVLEQRGAIRIVDAGEHLLADPYLDLSDDAGGPVVAGGELGLLGLAFHPHYADNHRLFVFYTTHNSDPANPYADVVVELAGTGDHADPATARTILSIPDFAANHNGGMIEFGADGLLYISTGDGGQANDPHGNGQNPNALLAKILRIDVDHGDPYAIPPDNPFAGGGGAPEVYVTGLRNAWRWTFDRATGDMWIGDVGQGDWEELDVLPAGQQAGKNLGWNMYEAHACFSGPCDAGDRVFPQFERNHSTGWNAIIGGQVYRGDCYPDLRGLYFFTDNGFGGLTTARLQGDGTLDITGVDGDFPAGPSAIHEAGGGELYETDTKGNLWRIEARP